MAAPTRCGPGWHDARFAAVFVPFGITSGFITTAMPFLLRQAGIGFQQIAALSAVAVGLSIFCFLWAPVVDLGWGRKRWLLSTALANAACLWAALQVRLPAHVALFAALVLMAGWCASMTHAAAGGLMATVAQEESRGRTGAWAQAGNLGGGALGAGLALWCAQRFGNVAAAYFIAAVAAACGLAGLAIREPHTPRTSVSTAVKRIHADMNAMLRSERSRLAMILLIAPIGSAGALTLLPALATDYHTSPWATILVTGMASSLFMTAGCLAGGALSDAMNRWYAYLGAGLALGCVALASAAAPLISPAFVISTSAYLFAAGLCYGAFSGFVLEVIGSHSAAAGGQYTIFTGIANLAAAYSIWLDGQAYSLWGPRAVFAADGLISVAAIVLLGCIFIRRKQVPAASVRP